MADRFFQGYVYQLQGSIPRTFGVIDNKEIVSCSNQELIGNRNSFQLMSCRAAENECFFAGNNTYRIFYENSFGNILNNLQKHYFRMDIVKPSWEERDYLGVGGMLYESPFYLWCC